VSKYGSSGAETTSGNARLQKYVMERGKAMGIPVPAVGQFQKAMEQATGRSVASAAREAEQFATRNDAREAGEKFDPRSLADTPSPAVDRPATARQALQGFLMEQQKQAQQALSKAATDE